MFGFLKNLLKRPAEATATDESFASSHTPPDAFLPAEAPVIPERRSASLHRNGHHNGKGVELPLQSILASLPLELQSRVRQPNVGDAILSIPLERILAQLAHGMVRVPFGELRQAFPDVFTGAADQDRVMVALPLADILARINPALIKRRRVQKQVQVPDEISSPFDESSRSLLYAGLSRSDTTPPAGAPPSVPPVAPAPTPSTAFVRQTSVPPPRPVIPGRGNLASIPTPFPPSATPVVPPVKIPPLRVARDLVAPQAPPPQAPPHPEIAAKAPVAAPPPPPPPAPSPVPPPAVAPQKPISGPVPFGPPEAPREPSVLVVQLVALADNWPDGVRKEILQSGMVESKLHLPTEVVEKGLRQGKILFAWRTLRSWIRPAAPAPVASPNDGATLELPLKVIAPLFLGRQKENSKQHSKVEVDEDIPNLFFGFPQPESAPGGAAATAKPSDTNFYVWDDRADTARLHESDVKRGPSAGTKFVSKYATPNEIVSRAAALDGVAGALIALPDGLLVASQLPADLNADTLAAFLPQIFGKVSQCTKELRMGELNNLNFTVGNLPWKIFRVNAIFFAAFGKAGEPLPTAQLAAMAGELDHKPK